MSLRILLSLIIVFTANTAIAGAWEERRAALEESAIFGDFRVFYSLEGAEALPPERRLDKNRDGIPDFIEKVGKRLLKANDFFAKDVGLIEPLKSKRYRGEASFIDVNILDFSKVKKGPKNGIAYDGIPKINRTRAGQKTSNVLTMDLSTLVRLKSQSVEHELFHLYQNGYTFFKNRWYTEGTARWSELVIRNRTGTPANLPATTADKLKLFKMSYDAKGFWNKIILTTDVDSLGKRFVKLFLEQLDVADDKAALERCINPTGWPESEQKSDRNNAYIWDATLKAAMMINNKVYRSDLHSLEEL